MTAKVYGPDGTLLFEATREREGRAILSCKIRQVRTKRVSEDAHELMLVYPRGTVIKVDDAVVCTWDGTAWVDAVVAP
jgi:hypothetical protein